MYHEIEFILYLAPLQNPSYYWIILSAPIQIEHLILINSENKTIKMRCN